METTTSLNLLKSALDVSLMRHEAISLNIANRETAGFQPLEVRFVDQLREEGGLSAEFSVLDTPVALDAEIAKGLENATYYRSLLRGIQHEFSLLRLSLQGGTGL
ncbi:flagellar basal body rod protein FlgB [Legionella geestiana]|uniref:Flagellar basal body rod protein FlgB n=1 Tax=Legionella geestiana TaxID=45065 RepID=A0A0W0TUH8_9GAMM|nr:hypothetical protein [Legionella geestiana]KTC99018.1 flagellar basal body rod protein FlgB [Legionella geestiana]QBS12649.1 hypothetical protein E4T54_07775 [Legionella geestiana]STX54890.1 flagellar basal body rod protein FlgB [Legionella geestiana]